MDAASTPEVSAPSNTPPLLLVVEDEVLVRTILSDFLREAGFRVIEAADAEQARDVLLAGVKPDLLITDVKMPGAMDGLELARVSRSLRPELKVIVVSGDAAWGDARRVSDLFLRKPYDLADVAERARQLLGRSAPDSPT